MIIVFKVGWGDVFSEEIVRVTVYMTLDFSLILFLTLLWLVVVVVVIVLSLLLGNVGSE